MRWEYSTFARRKKFFFPTQAALQTWELGCIIISAMRFSSLSIYHYYFCNGAAPFSRLVGVTSTSHWGKALTISAIVTQPRKFMNGKICSPQKDFIPAVLSLNFIDAAKIHTYTCEFLPFSLDYGSGRSRGKYLFLNWIFPAWKARKKVGIHACFGEI